MKTLSKVGTIATGAVMLGAALSGAVSAGLDSTGLTKDFFYDADFNPSVQIVVGEKGMATDAVAAGNIAATVGNLAYATATTEVAAEGAAEGQVTLGVAAIGATGRYKQTNNQTLQESFYNENLGLRFHSELNKYEKGEFVSYSLACGTQERTEAGILKDAKYNNIHCLFCATLCLQTLENPEHEFSEAVQINWAGMKWYESGMYKDDAEDLVLEIDKKSVTYIVDAGEIPMTLIGPSQTDAIDFEWRGKFLLFGEEYYVKDIKGDDEIYLAKGKVLEDISSEGYTSEYMGYKFKVDHLIYSAEFTVAGILLDVEKPDGTVVQAQVSKMANGIVDDIEVSGIYAEEADQVATASLIVYDTTSNVKLEDGKDMELGGEVKKYWRVSFAKTGSRAATLATSASPDVTEYQGEYGRVLHNITVQYRHDIKLEEGESLDFPSTFKLTFNGYRTSDYRTTPVTGDGEGNVKICKDGRYQLLLSFTDDGGNRWDDVRLDQGPITEGDRVVIGNKAYEFVDSYEKTGNNTRLYIKLRDLLDGGTEEYPIDAITSPSTFWLRTVAFESKHDNDAYTRVVPDSIAADSDVYAGTILSTATLYDGGDVYFDVSASSSLNCSIGVSQNQWSSAITDFEVNGNDMDISVRNENNTQCYIGETGTDLNDYTGSSTAGTRADSDDTLLVIHNENGEYVVVDMYDRNYNDSIDLYKDESVKASLSNLPLNTTRPEVVYLNNDRDTLLILPNGGDRVIVDYGSDYEIECVEVLHPQENVDATTFIGTSEEETVLESVITEADVGTTKTVGCCTYTVEEFAVSGAGATATATEVTVKPVPSNLVVPEVSADTTKNLVIVGGPAVNGMTTVTADEIAAASSKYIVKKDGKKLIVAGWTAADTVEAGSALVDWLEANVH